MKLPAATVEVCNWSNENLVMPSIYMNYKARYSFYVSSNATYRMVEVPFGWRNQCLEQDGSIHDCLLNKEAYALRHDQNSPPFCRSQQSAEER